jgi:hypothetical protein
MKQQSQQTMIPYKEVPLLSLDIDPTRSCARTKVFLTFHKVASLADFRILQAEHNLGAAKLQAPKNEFLVTDNMASRETADDRAIFGLIPILI